MPIQTLTPTAEGNNQAWTLIAGADKVAAVSSEDDGASYIRAAAGSTYYQTFFVGALDSLAIGVNSVDALATLAHGVASGGNCHIGVSISGALSYQNFAPYDAWILYTYSNVPRPGGTTWAKSDFPGGSGTEVGPYENSGSASVDCTYCALKVNYNIPGGGFSFLIASLAGAALGLAEMPRLASVYYRQAGILITPSEYSTAWREHREARRPSFFGLGRSA